MNAYLENKDDLLEELDDRPKDPKNSPAAEVEILRRQVCMLLLILAVNRTSNLMRA